MPKRIIDLDYMKDALQKIIVEVGPEHRAECFYYDWEEWQHNNEIVPVCIIGHFLEREQLTDRILLPVGEVSDVASDNADVVFKAINAEQQPTVYITKAASRFARVVQTHQDQGACWADAYATGLSAITNEEVQEDASETGN